MFGLFKKRPSEPVAALQAEPVERADAMLQRLE